MRKYRTIFRERGQPKENWISTSWEGREIDGKEMQHVSVIKDRDRNVLTYTSSVIKGREECVEEQMNEEN